MPGFTLRYPRIPSDAEIAAVDAVVHRHSGRISWQNDAQFACTYALVEHAGENCAAELGAGTNAEIFDPPIIALAVFPQVAEALPFLQHALGGEGAPDAMVRCDRSGDAVILEWHGDRTPVTLVFALIDAELRRFNSARVTRLLAPMPAAWWTRIAADGLQSPDIATDRVLEELLEQHGVVD